MMKRKVSGDRWKNRSVPLAAPSPATLRVGDLSHFVGEVYDALTLDYGRPLVKALKVINV
jgi:hypothetical protein